MIAALAGRYAKLLISAAIIAPCFWQARIQAGDLASHQYNGWLAELVGKGEAPGLFLAPIWTNVLFDWALSVLMPLAGYELGAKIAVACCVLIFFWGAMTWVRKLSGTQADFLAPVLAMFTYGFVFHMGFFNFYLSFGICLWAMTLAVSRCNTSRAAAALLAVPAYLAHAMPVLWAGALLAYWIAARRMRPRRRWILLVVSLALVLVVRTWIVQHYEFFWSQTQILAVTGADQLYVFGKEQMAFMGAMLLFWSIAGFRLLFSKRLEAIWLGIPAQLAALHAVALFLIPFTIQIPSFNTPLDFVTTRMSLAMGLCVCALIARTPPSRVLRAGAILFAAVFFAAIFVSTLALNRTEDRLEKAARALPRGARAVAVYESSPARNHSNRHMLSRACIGHCFNYANYEPATLQFRIRARAGNWFVTTSSEDSVDMQDGKYKVKAQDAPLYVLASCNGGADFCVSLKQAGETLR